jgi:hypothetical protein
MFQLPGQPLGENIKQYLDKTGDMRNLFMLALLKKKKFAAAESRGLMLA